MCVYKGLYKTLLIRGRVNSHIDPDKEMIDTIECVSYGLGVCFNKAVMQPIQNKHYKPLGGLWGSPTDSEDSWKSFVISEETSKSLKSSFTWTFKGKLLVIQDNEEWEELILKYPHKSNSDFIDWEAIACHYDGAFVFSDVEYFDCDSILVFKSECVFI